MLESLKSLISFLETDPEPCIVLDPDYQVLGANKAYRAAYTSGQEPSPIGRKCYEVSHRYDKPCDLSGELCPMNSARQSNASAKVLHIHFTPRGREHVDVELRPIHDDGGNIIAFVEKVKTVKTASVLPTKSGLVGSSAAFNRALSDLQRVAKTDLPVLLQGESGTGKELFARAVHDASERSTAPFVVVDCTGLTDTLFESEIFGYEKGAFTGASQAKAGLVETAKGGTVFLDEIGDMPLTMQVKLLRLLESGTFRRVGGLEEKRADFRLVAATHKPLAQMVEDGSFRADLFYRICVFPIRLPALRERAEDLPKLVESLLRRGSGTLGRQFEVSPAAMQILAGYAWPGNVRQLKNVLDRARVLADEDLIDLQHLPAELRQPLTLVKKPVAPPAPPHFADYESTGKGVKARRLGKEELIEMERQFPGTRKELAQQLGISERTLYRKLGKN